MPNYIINVMLHILHFIKQLYLNSVRRILADIDTYKWPSRYEYIVMHTTQDKTQSRR